jgi:hypothetical protein
MWPIGGSCLEAAAGTQHSDWQEAVARRLLPHASSEPTPPLPSTNSSFLLLLFSSTISTINHQPSNIAVAIHSLQLFRVLSLAFLDLPPSIPFDFLVTIVNYDTHYFYTLFEKPFRTMANRFLPCLLLVAGAGAVAVRGTSTPGMFAHFDAALLSRTSGLTSPSLCRILSYQSHGQAWHYRHHPTVQRHSQAESMYALLV